MSEDIGSVDKLSVAIRIPGVAGDGAVAVAAVTNLRSNIVITITNCSYHSLFLTVPAVS